MSNKLQLRRALEMLARKHNPPHSPTVEIISLRNLGATSLDLSAVPLNNAWLPGIDFQDAVLPSSGPPAWNDACLHSANLPSGDDSTALALNRCLLLNTSLNNGRTAKLSDWPTLSHPLGQVGRFTPFCYYPLPDGRLIIGCADGRILLWSISQNKQIASFSGHDGPVYCVAPLDNDRFISGSDDKSLRLWSISQNKQIASFSGHKDWVRCVARLDNDRFISGSYDQSLRLWSISQNKQIASFSGHKDWVRCVARLDDDRFISGSDDQSLRLWSLKTGKVLARLTGHTASVSQVYVQQAGQKQQIVSKDTDGRIFIWEERQGWLLKQVMIPLAEGIIYGADQQCCWFINQQRPWSARSVNGELWPNDPLLHEYASFVLPEKQYVVPIAWHPKTYADGSPAWAWEDKKNPVKYIQYWPKANRQEIVKKVLGYVETAHEDPKTKEIVWR